MVARRGPKRLTIKGIRCVKTGEPMQLGKVHWETYQPEDDGLFVIYERCIETGQVIVTVQQ